MPDSLVVQILLLAYDTLSTHQYQFTELNNQGYWTSGIKDALSDSLVFTADVRGKGVGG